MSQFSQDVYFNDSRARKSKLYEKGAMKINYVLQTLCILTQDWSTNVMASRIVK